MKLIKIRITKLTFFTILMCTLLYACQYDDQIEYEEESKITIKRINSNEIEQNSQITYQLQNIKEQFLDNTNERTEYNEENDFYIDTEEAIYIEFEDYHSYTFFIYRDNYNGYVENITLSLNADSTYESKLVQYPLNENGSLDLSGALITNIGGIDSNSLFRNDPYCRDGYYIELDYIDAYGNEYDDSIDCPSINGVPCDVLIIWVPCPDNANINAGDSTNNDGSGNDNGNGSTNGDNDSGGSSNGDTNGSNGNNNPGDGGSNNNPPGGGGSGDGSNPQGDTNTNGNNNSDDNTQNDDDDCVLDSDGNCINDMTSPVLPKAHQKNCTELAQLGNTPAILNSFNDLGNKVNDITIQREFGYKYTEEQNPSELPLINGDPLHVKPQFGNDIYGLAHTHPQKAYGGQVVYPMFSMDDIFNLGVIANTFDNQPNSDFSKVFFSLTVKGSNGPETFALKVNNFFSLSAFTNSFSSRQIEWNKKLNDRYNEISENNGGNVTQNYLQALFEFLQEENIPLDAFDIYRATNSDHTDWKKQSYNSSDNSITEVDCNN